ncbi:MAG: AbrB/MazE/SpoVT family DNA-binding domain-containing protein [Clostridia bacterium]
MSKGQITIPKDIRKKLGISIGDRVTLICEDDRVILMNSAVYKNSAESLVLVGRG